MCMGRGDNRTAVGDGHGLGMAWGGLGGVGGCV